MKFVFFRYFLTGEKEVAWEAAGAEGIKYIRWRGQERKGAEETRDRRDCERIEDY